MKILILVSTLFSKFKQDGIVCSEDELIRELIEDIEDNGNSILNLIARQTGLPSIFHRHEWESRQQ